MVPVPDSTGPSPEKVSITFSEAVEPKFSSINVTSADGKTKLNTAASQPVAGDPKTLTLALPTLPAGGYLVKWVSVAPDGHRMEGEYAFTVK
jgi:methionine-rich copper-binding protein CopC